MVQNDSENLGGSPGTDEGAENANPVQDGSDVTMKDGETETKGVVKKFIVDKDNVLDELMKILVETDSKVGTEIFGVINQFMTWFPSVDKLDGFILLYGANAFLHQIVKVIKRNKLDSRNGREVARVWTVLLFKLDDPEWTPSWLFKPFEAEKADE